MNMEDKMESVMAMSNVMSVPSVGNQVGRQQMPLTFMRAGESAQVFKVRGTGEMHHHLENLGFVQGEPVRVVADISGNLIVQVKQARIAISRELAVRIMV